MVLPPGKLGPLVGKRTWGGLVGIGGYPPLLDGGTVTAPHFAFWTPEGKWDVENHGVPPDVEVEFDPKPSAPGPRPAAGEGGGAGAGGAEEEPADEAEAAGVSQLSQDGETPAEAGASPRQR